MTGCRYKVTDAQVTLVVFYTSVQPTGSLINNHFCALSIKNSLTLVQSYDRKVLGQTCVTIENVPK